MKSGLPFSRALASWNRKRLRGPFLAMVFPLLGVAVASSGALSHGQGDSHVLQSARTYSPLGERNEFFLHNLANALTDDVRVQANRPIFETQNQVFLQL